MKNKNTLSLIIAAAGNASRFGQNLRSKQFLLLNDKPLLVYSLEKFVILKNILEIIIVTNDIDATNELLRGMDFLANIEIKTVLGGPLRKESVYNGFCNVNTSVDLVLIHDVARPLFNISDVEKCIEKAAISKAAILAIPNVDTLKKVRLDKDDLVVNTTIDRDGLYLIQTPQVFSYDLLSNAYKMYKSLDNLNAVFTDEARLIELLGKPVNLVIGDRKNVKITYPEDLEIASSILREVEKQRSKCLN